MNLKEAIILAGGMDTRFKSIVKEEPKSIASINGIPFLEYLIDHLIKNGIERVIFSVGFESFTKANKFFGYQSDGYYLDGGIPEDFAKAQKYFLKFGCIINIYA